MSSFSGDPHGRWSLNQAVDSLAESARMAGRPGLIWIAGMVYPTVSLGLGTGTLIIKSHRFGGVNVGL